MTCLYAYVDKGDPNLFLLSGYMVYKQNKKGKYKVKNTWGFCCGSNIDVNVFRAMMQYLDEMEYEFKKKLDELFRPPHLDLADSVAKRRKVEGIK